MGNKWGNETIQVIDYQYKIEKIVLFKRIGKWLPVVLHTGLEFRYYGLCELKNDTMWLRPA